MNFDQTTNGRNVRSDLFNGRWQICDGLLFQRLSRLTCLPDRESTWEGKAAQVAVFAVTKWLGTPVNAAPHEHSAIAWYRADELAALSMHDAARVEALGLLG